MKLTKVFKSGNSFAVRLPKEFAVKEKELYITKVGNKIILFPPEKRWDVVFEEFEEIKDLCNDFLEERNQPKPQEREFF